MMNKLGGIFLMVLLLALPGPVLSREGMVSEEVKVEAFLIGYEGDDIIFRIVNKETFDIEIKGLSYRKQMLYRPIEKGVTVPLFSEEAPWKEVKFRTTGEFIWSENHMKKFRLSYVLVGSKEKMYAPIYPKSQAAEQ